MIIFQTFDAHNSKIPQIDQTIDDIPKQLEFNKSFMFTNKVGSAQIKQKKYNSPTKYRPSPKKTVIKR